MRYLGSRLLIVATVLGMIISSPSVGFGFQVPTPKSKKRSPAAINRAALSMAAPSRVLYGNDGQSLSPDLIAAFNMIKNSEKPFDVSSIVPLNLQPGSSSSVIMSSIADRSFSTFWNSQALRDTAFGRTAHEMEEQLRTEVVVSDNTEKGIQHKIQMNLEAFQQRAKIAYTGFADVAVNYKINESAMGIELKESLSGTSDLVISHGKESAEDISRVSVIFNF